MGYHYDPILCMNVPDGTSKAKDAKIQDDARSDFSKVIALTKQIDEITRKYARKIDANAMFAYTDQIRNKVQYYIDNASRGWYDAAPADVRDASDRDKRAFENIKNMAKNIQRSSDVLHDFIVIKNTANQIQDKTLKAEAMKIVNSMASKIRSVGSHDALDKAIRMVCDSTRAYNQYYNSIRDENYEMASRLFRQAEQDDELTDQEVDKLLLFFKSKFGKGPR